MIENEKNLNSSLANYRRGEIDILERYQALVEKHGSAPLVQLYNFPRVCRTQEFTKLFALNELYQLARDVHGSFIEVGVLDGFNVFALGHLCEIYEHRHYTRKIFGFDTFEGYRSLVPEKDVLGEKVNLPATFDYELLSECVDLFNDSIAFHQFRKIELIKGDAVATIPSFVAAHPELVVSLLLLQTDIYGPTKAALTHLYPRMPRGGIVAFVAVNHDAFPGETLALAETLGVEAVALRRFPFATKLSYFVKP